MLDVREEAVQKLLDLPYSALRKLQGGRRVCEHRNEDCDALLYGSLIRELEKFRLYPQKSAKDIQISVDALSKQIASILLSELPNTGHGHHTLCGTRFFRDAVNKVVTGVSCPVLDTHHDHLEKKQ